MDKVHLVVSSGARKVLEHETRDLEPVVDSLVGAAGLAPFQLAKVVEHADDDLGARIASGSYRLDGTVVLPCSGSTLAAVATGRAETLIQRSAAVALKEGWPLVLGVRETPLGVLHIENMRRLAYQGAVLLPPMPAFYVGGEDMGRFLDAYAMRLLDCLGVESSLGGDLRWQGTTRGGAA